MTTGYSQQSLFSRAHDWTERNEFLTFIIIAALALSVVFGGMKLYKAQAAHRASENAKNYVGRRTFAGAKWFMFQGRVELFEEGQKEGEGLSVPVNTDFGDRVTTEFIKSWREGSSYEPNLKFPLTVNISYGVEPQNKWPADGDAKDYEEGAYLHFEEVAPAPAAVAKTLTGGSSSGGH